MRASTLTLTCDVGEGCRGRQEGEVDSTKDENIQPGEQEGGSHDGDEIIVFRYRKDSARKKSGCPICPKADQGLSCSMGDLHKIKELLEQMWK